MEEKLYTSEEVTKVIHWLVQVCHGIGRPEVMAQQLQEFPEELQSQMIAAIMAGHTVAMFTHMAKKRTEDEIESMELPDDIKKIFGLE